MKNKYKIAIIGIVVVIGALAFATVPLIRDKLIFTSAEKKINRIVDKSGALASESQVTKNCEDTTFIYSKGDNFCDYRIDTQLAKSGAVDIQTLSSEMSAAASDQGWVFLRDNTPVSSGTKRKILIFKQSKLNCVIDISAEKQTTIQVGCSGMSKYRIY